MNVADLLAAAAYRRPAAEALISGAERLNYADYAASAAGFAAELHGAARIAVLMHNSADMAIALWAAWAAGAQVVPLNPLYTPAERGPILEDAAPDLIISDGPTAWTTPTARVSGRRWTGLTLEPVEAELASLQYTGGTTGRAKGVELTHAATLANIGQRDELLPIHAADRILSVAPLYHVYAIAMGLHLAAAGAATLVLMPHYERAALLDLLKRERISVFAGNPRLYAALLEGDGPGELDELRLCLSGSAALPESVLRRWESITGAPIAEGYGQTEAGPVLSYNPASGRRKPGTVGLPLPETQIEIAEDGEIRARGPQLMRGYRNRPEETAAALRDGWLYTGDTGAFDADGYLSILGRKKEMVIVSGFNVYPREVEDALGQHQSVHEAAVIGRPDPRTGEKLVAFIVPRAPVSIDEIRTHLAERLVRYKWPAEITLVDELPRTPVGKVDRGALAKQ